MDPHRRVADQTAEAGRRSGLRRRQLLGMGALSLTGLAVAHSMARAAPYRPAPRARACLFIDLYGGASQIDTFDPKPAAPAEIRGPYQPIATTVPGIQITELLPRLAALAQTYSLVRSMTHGDANHDGGTHVALTGRSRPADETPYFGSVVARFRPSEENIPSYVWLQNIDVDVKPRFRTGGLLGSAFAPLCLGEYEDNPADPGFRFRGFDRPPEVTSPRLAARQQLARRLDSQPGSIEGPAAAQFARFHERALELVAGSKAQGAFDLNLERPETRERYGPGPLGQNLLLARRLVEAGVRLVAVNAWPGYPQGRRIVRVSQGWDMHGAAVQKSGIFSNEQFGLGFALPVLDQALSALLEDLSLSGLLETTLVIVVGEFGRTPRIVHSPYPGRDHWPQCYSALWAGAGVRGGSVWGASDANGAFVKDRPVTPEDFGATLYHALGIPPETRYGADGFSERVSAGEPLRELFGS